MKLTPLDIHHKEFRHSLRGYSEEEVDAFLDEVADEFERLFKENIDLAEKLDAANERLREYEQMEKTVHNTLVAAQKSAEDIEASAQKEADLTRKDAELRAKEVIHEALTLKQKTQNEFMRIKEAETHFRQAFRNLLEDHLGRLQEIPVPDEFAVLGAQAEAAEELVASMDSVQQAQPAVQEASAPPASADPEASAAGAVVFDHAMEAVIEADEVEAAPSPVEELSGSVDTSPADGLLGEGELPTSGFVTSVQLGELEDTDYAAETPVYEEEPASFDIPMLDSLGERDDDLDIEEID